MKKWRLDSYTGLGFLAGVLLTVAALVSCGGGSASAPMSSTTGTVNTYLSDPPTCTLDFQHVYVTITKVQANINPNAGPTDSGWQTLAAPTTPIQVDLMSLNPGATTNFCGTLFLLGKETLPTGTYQQIRFILLSNSPAPGTATPSSNACGNGNGWNCVVTSSGTSELQLSSEAQTGIKIPSPNITSGGLTVTAGQSVDLNINFDSCASIVPEGNGQYRLTPVLHAGEVSLNTNTISGTVVEGSGAPNPGAPIANAIVLLEQAPTGSTTDQVVPGGTTTTDANGAFAFCPIPASSSSSPAPPYDVVVAGQTTQTSLGVTTMTTYNPSVVFGVPVGGGTGSIPLFAETTTGSTTGLVTTRPASISGQITSTGGSKPTPVPGEVQLSAFQTATNGTSTVTITVPVFTASAAPSSDVTDSQPPIYSTDTASGGCATSTAACVAYAVAVPASAVAAGVYSPTSGNTVTAPSSTESASYTINVLADGSDSLLTCSPTSLTSSSLTVSQGSSTTTVNFNLTGCSAP